MLLVCYCTSTVGSTICFSPIGRLFFLPFHLCNSTAVFPRKSLPGQDVSACSSMLTNHRPTRILSFDGRVHLTSSGRMLPLVLHAGALSIGGAQHSLHLIPASSMLLLYHYLLAPPVCTHAPALIAAAARLCTTSTTNSTVSTANAMPASTHTRYTGTAITLASCMHACAHHAPIGHYLARTHHTLAPTHTMHARQHAVAGCHGTHPSGARQEGLVPGSSYGTRPCRGPTSEMNVCSNKRCTHPGRASLLCSK